MPREKRGQAPKPQVMNAQILSTLEVPGCVRRITPDAVTWMGPCIEVQVSELKYFDEHNLETVGRCETSYKTVLGRFSFDRYGVEDSFYIYRTDTPDAVLQTLQAQVARAQAAIERQAQSEMVPEIGFTVTPEKKAQLIALFKAKKGYTFRPRGFGTAYHLTPGRPKYKWDTPAGPALVAFFGVGPLSIGRQDCD